MSPSRKSNRYARRTEAGERLALALGADAHRAVYVTATPGGTEVAAHAALGNAHALLPMTKDERFPDVVMPRPGTMEFLYWVAAAPPFPDERVEEARVVVFVDDGLMPTGDIVSLAASLRAAGARRLVVASPWLSGLARTALALIADRVVCGSLIETPIRYPDPVHPEAIAVHGPPFAARPETAGSDNVWS